MRPGIRSIDDVGALPGEHVGPCCLVEHPGVIVYASQEQAQRAADKSNAFVQRHIDGAQPHPWRQS